MFKRGCLPEQALSFPLRLAPSALRCGLAGERRSRGCEDRLLEILIALLRRSARLQRNELVKDGAGILLVSVWLGQEHLELL